jgi:hypothetical protein
VSHRFRQDKFENGGSISTLPQLPQKMKFALKVGKVDFENNHLATKNLNL